MNIRTRKPLVIVAMTAGIALAGCATQQPYGTRQDGYGYQQGYGQGGRCQSCGVVQDVQQVYVQRNGNGTLGAVLGAVAGGLLGNTVGKGDGRKAATVAGAVAGGVVGNQVGQRSGSGTDVAWQVSVRLDNGQYATVTQREDPGVRRGDYVEVRGDHVYKR
ncbi:glycine zipper 2TM domain-containing protein [Fulvimonas sp. R45]|uniref:glycine zipper 2TM domain-containing protein n=1 Tax=Fulvimonas sp. R45 TaxID=3045937 RepID=UPI00265EE2CC|nr:glycine zipper 2TM domain-containing protein [Fulvimonas sp. R45]MDO1527430.1 glycine zipper 2TM domain-containing protein [Fulvimonas sp. R45]